MVAGGTGTTGGTDASASVLYEPLALPLELSPGEDVASEWRICLFLRAIAGVFPQVFPMWYLGRVPK